MNRPAWRTGRWTPLLVLLVGLGLSAWVGLWQHRQNQAAANAEFDRVTSRLALAVERRFRNPLYGLNGAAGTWAAVPALSRSQFRAYVESRDLPREFPGVRGFGLLQPVTRAALPAFVAATRRDGAPNFAVIGAGTVSGAPPDDTLYPLKYLEPAAAQPGLLGRDLGQQAAWQQAIDQAIASGQPTLSPPFPWAGEPTGPRPAYLLLRPVYQPHAASGTAAQRRAALLGLLCAPLVVDELLAGLLDGDPGQLSLTISDASSATPAATHAATPSEAVFSAGPGAPAGSHRASHLLHLHGRVLQLTSTSTPAFDQALNPLTPLWWVGLLALASLTLATLLGQEAQGRQLAERHSDAMSAEVQRLALVARKTSNAVVITDVQRRITWVNHAFEHITGHLLEEALGQSPGALLQFAGTDPATVLRMRHALNAVQPFVGKIHNIGKTGRAYWLMLEIQPVRDAQGQHIGFMAIETDISEQMAAEATLRASQAFLDKAGRIGGVGGWAVDLATQAVVFSDQSCRILDLEPGHHPTLADCLHYCAPQARPRIEAAIARGFDGATSWDAELPFVTARGREIWVRLVAEGEFADSGPVRVVGALQDVTERRQMQAEVQRNAQLLRGAIDAIDEAFVLYDPQDRLVFCNDKHRELYASSAAMIQPGQCFEDIVRHGVARGQYPAAAGREQAWIDERLAQHRAGNTTLVQQIDSGRVVRLIERRLPDGHLVGFHIDITDLVRASQAAESASRAKGEFIATVSHELRTPLQSILGFSALGQRFAQDQPHFQGMFDDIHQGGRRMLTLVNGLLDVSKAEDDLHAPALQRLDLAALLAGMLRELRPLAEQRRVSLQLDGPAVPLPVLADAFRLEQVLRNVLANAIRFAPADSTVHLAGMARPDGGSEVTVRDHGPGIPPDELESIFEAFVQSSRTRDGSGGTGLGLAICRKILKAHGGHIVAENAAGGGARMRIHLPPPAEPRDIPVGQTTDSPTAQTSE